MPRRRARGVAAETLRVLREAWPLMVAEATGSIASLVDLFFVSRLGLDAVAGVGAGGYASWLLGVPLAVFYVGVLVVASQALGAGMRSYAARVVGEGLSAAVLSSIPLAAAGYAAAPLLSQWLASGAASSAAVLYLRARLLGLPAFAATLVLDAAHRAAASNRRILAASAASALANAALDPLLIYAAGLGVAGAGLATSISWLASAAALAYPPPGIGPLRPAAPGAAAARVAVVGAPAMAERLLFAGGNVVYLATVARCGTAALAAHTVGVRLESLAFLPGFALSTHASSVVGRLVGAGRLEEAREAGWRVAVGSAGFMALAGLLLLAASPLAALLAPGAGRLVVLYMVLAAASEPALGLVMALGGAVRGAGDTRTPTIINLAGLYLVRVVPSALLPGLPGAYCPAARWLLMSLDLWARAAAFTYVYRTRFRRLARRLV